MNAVIKVGGKQYYVSEGTEIFVEKLDAEEGNTVNFNQVLMLDKKVGSPYLTNVTVEGEVLKNGKHKKIRVYKYKCKDKSNRKTQGHRQPYTKVKITKINADYGKDIVCASVSSIVITTVNGILALNKGSLSYLNGKLGMKIEIKNEDKTTQILIGNMISLLKELEGNYPDNIEVK